MGKSDLLAGAGLAFKPNYFDAIMAEPSRVDFLEIHAENYFGDGGLLHAQLMKLRQLMPLSVHGVGLSLGGSDPLDKHHLERLRRLCDRYEPALVSEHLAWSSHAGHYLADLLPVAYNEKNLGSTVEHVEQVQDYLGRQLLIENPSRYLSMADSDMDEAEFLCQLTQRSGCGLLLDLNNLIVSCFNCGGDALNYLARMPVKRVGELHLAGHSLAQRPSGDFVIDDHASEVADVTWALYEQWLQMSGVVPTLIEWDKNLPSWAVLAAEVDCARSLMCATTMAPAECRGGHR